jgi:hypothetical protein
LANDQLASASDDVKTLPSLVIVLAALTPTYADEPAAGAMAASGRAPDWVPSGAQIYVDFVNNRAWDGIAKAAGAAASLISVSNASPPKYTTRSTVSAATANTLALATSCNRTHSRRRGRR